MPLPQTLTCAVAVVGAGPAGQMAALAAAEAGCPVILLEQMPRAGLKLQASGGGRGNLTRLAPPSAFYAAFGRQGRFLSPALDAMGPERLREFLAGLGVPTVVEEGGAVYPASQRAADVQAALRRRLDRLGVALHLGRAVTRLSIRDGRCAGVEVDGGPVVEADRVILACGGQSWPALGGTGGGYALARQAGHAVVQPVPALVPLVTRQSWPARLAGVALPAARVRIDLPGRHGRGAAGDILFTHRGLSGPAVLDLSGDVARLLAEGRGEVPLRLEPVAGMDAPRWGRQLEAWRGSDGPRGVANLLRRRLPASLGRLACELAGLDERTPAAQLTRPAREALSAILGGMELAATGTEGFDAAFVTRGGVRLREVDPRTLRSRLLGGLYFAGELLDLDGPTGGFNLQWAFAGGWLAGKAAASQGA